MNDELRKDILFFLTKMHELSHEDKIRLLVNLFEKNLILKQSSLRIGFVDFNSIISRSKNLVAQASLPVKIGNKQLDYSEINQAMMVMAVVEFLNSKDALKKEVLLEGER
jgi:hypothetical protein